MRLVSLYVLVPHEDGQGMVFGRGTLRDHTVTLFRLMDAMYPDQLNFEFVRYCPFVNEIGNQNILVDFPLNV